MKGGCICGYVCVCEERGRCLTLDGCVCGCMCVRVRTEEGWRERSEGEGSPKSGKFLLLFFFYFPARCKGSPKSIYFPARYKVSPESGKFLLLYFTHFLKCWKVARFFLFSSKMQRVSKKWEISFIIFPTFWKGACFFLFSSKIQSVSKKWEISFIILYPLFEMMIYPLFEMMKSSMFFFIF